MLKVKIRCLFLRRRDDYKGIGGTQAMMPNLRLDCILEQLGDEPGVSQQDICSAVN